MADENSKQQLIEAFRLMPEGIREFLDKPLPTAPTISTPADVDAAIIASGVLSKMLLDLFATFAGFTPIEMLSRIGQHNSVQEIAMLAGLEYVKGQDGTPPDPEDFGVTILEPADGATYLPGTLRIRAKGVNGDLVHCEYKFPDNSPISMDDIGDGVFEGAITLEDQQSYTVTVNGMSSDDLQVTATVGFTITDDPDAEPPGGTDDPAVQVAHGRLVDAFRKLADCAVRFDFNAYVRALFAICKTYYGIWLAILRCILKGDVLTALETLDDEAQSCITYVQNAIDQKDPNALINFVGQWAGLVMKMGLLGK